MNNNQKKIIYLIYLEYIKYKKNNINDLELIEESIVNYGADGGIDNMMCVF